MHRKRRAHGAGAIPISPYRPGAARWHRYQRLGARQPAKLCQGRKPRATVCDRAGVRRRANGRPKLQPSTKYHKGTMVMEAVGANVQLELFEVPETHTATVASPSIATWILLYHVAEDEIRYELSLPIETIGGYISGWREAHLPTPGAQPSDGSCSAAGGVRPGHRHPRSAALTRTWFDPPHGHVDSQSP